MKIVHVSDMHGKYTPIMGDFDAVVCSGDIFPYNTMAVTNNNLTSKYVTAKNQIAWLEDNIDLIKRWVKNKPLFFVLGNHDFIDPVVMEKILKVEGINATHLHNKLVSFNGLSLYGFPYIPYINGCFNFETEVYDMGKASQHLLNVLQSKIDILVMHAPIYNVLDLALDGNHYGNIILTNALNSSNVLPKYVLFGHVHNCGSKLVDYKGMKCSNAACNQNIILV